MITLYQYFPGLGLPNPSPFCMKLETWLRMAEVPYEVKSLSDPRKTPMGKLPMIEHEGHQVADSSSAIEYMERTFDINLNAHMNPQERGQCHSLARMLEEHSYWALVYFRWIDDASWPQVKNEFFGKMPAPVRALLPGMLRKQVNKQLRGHGLGRHSPDEIQHRYALDIAAAAAMLGGNPYFGGYQAANIDATAYASIAPHLQSSVQTPLSEITRQHGNLVEYCNRMRERYFPEI